MSANPLSILDFNAIFDEDMEYRIGSAYKRVTLNLTDGTVASKDLLLPDEAVGGNLGFPKINPLWAGRKQCFTYLTSFRGDRQTSVVKYDHCGERVAGEWNAGATGKLPTEMVFVASPDSGPDGGGSSGDGSGGSSEDDGVLVGMVFDTGAQQSSFVVVDAKTMLTLASAPLPFRVSWPLHGTFLPAGAQ
jgi:carotenoid cleavage dioxygenase-like enzyme